MKYAALILFILSSFSYAQESAPKKTAEQAEEMQDFKKTQFLQLDYLSFPPELKPIEEELKRNIIDVVLASNTHSPIFAKKREDGYSASYTRIFGLKVTLVPKVGDSHFYELKLFYYNWTTNKYDKELVKKVSKFNILNDMRFAIFEMLNGKNYVRDNYDKIQRLNFERIQVIRRDEEERAALQKKKLRKTPKSDDSAAEELTPEERKRQKLLRKEREKEKNPDFTYDSSSEELGNVTSKLGVTEEDTEDYRFRTSKAAKAFQVSGTDMSSTDKRPNSKSSSGIPLVSADEKKNSSPENAKINQATYDPGFSLFPSFDTPKVKWYQGTAIYFNEYNKSEGNLVTSTNLRYLGLGARFFIEELTEKPRGYKFSVKLGVPVFKDNYDFPIYRSLDAEVFRRKIYNHFKLLVGAEYSPVYSVNLPAPGQNLQVFQNDFLWAKVGFGIEDTFNQKSYGFRVEYMKSILSHSNQKIHLKGDKIVLAGVLQVVKMLGMELSASRAMIKGDQKITADNIQLSIMYQFKN